MVLSIRRRLYKKQYPTSLVSTRLLLETNLMIALYLERLLNRTALNGMTMRAYVLLLRTDCYFTEVLNAL